MMDAVVTNLMYLRLRARRKALSVGLESKEDKMISRNENLCPLCGGEKREGKTTFTVDSPRQNRKVVSNEIGSRQTERNG